MRTPCMLAAATATFLFALPARAHIQMQSPTARYKQDNNGLKDAPCGSGVATNAITPLVPGQSLTVTWKESISHAGHFRIALAAKESDFTEPTSLDIPSSLPDWDLADGIQDKTGTQTYNQVVKIPDKECPACVLQLLQIMSTGTDGTNTGPFSGVYHACADVSILASNAGDAGATADASAGTDALKLDARRSTDALSSAGGAMGSGGASGNGGDMGVGGTAGEAGNGGQEGTGGATGSGGNAGSGGVSPMGGNGSGGTSSSSTGGHGAGSGGEGGKGGKGGEGGTTADYGGSAGTASGGAAATGGHANTGGTGGTSNQASDNAAASGCSCRVGSQPRRPRDGLGVVAAAFAGLLLVRIRGRMGRRRRSASRREATVGMPSDDRAARGTARMPPTDPGGPGGPCPRR
jgi:hypothetical protein